jgi:hypothetical protein
LTLEKGPAAHKTSAGTVIEKYSEWLPGQPDLLAALPELKGKTVVCWCAPLACHANVLAELANAHD